MNGIVTGIYYAAKAANLIATGASLAEKGVKAYKGEPLTTSEKVQAVLEGITVGLGAASMGYEAHCQIKEGRIKGLNDSLKTTKDELTKIGLEKTKEQIITALKASEKIRDILIPISAISLSISRFHPLACSNTSATKKQIGYAALAFDVIFNALLLGHMIVVKPDASLSIEQAQKALDKIVKDRKLIKSFRDLTAEVFPLFLVLCNKSPRRALEAPLVHPIAAQPAPQVPIVPVAPLIAVMEEEDQAGVRAVLEGATPERIAELIARFDQEIPNEFRDHHVFSTFIDPITDRVIRFPVGFEDSPAFYERASLERWIEEHPAQPVPQDNKLQGRRLNEIKPNLALQAIIVRECEKIKVKLQTAANLLAQAQAV